MRLCSSKTLKWKNYNCCCSVQPVESKKRVNKEKISNHRAIKSINVWFIFPSLTIYKLPAYAHIFCVLKNKVMKNEMGEEVVL